MKLGKFLQSLFSSGEADEPIDDRPLSNAPLPSRAMPTGGQTKSAFTPPKKSARTTYDGLLDFLKRPQNAQLTQEMLAETQHLGVRNVMPKIHKALREQGETQILNAHPRDFAESLEDALYEIRKTAPPPPEEDGQMEVILEAVGEKKVMVVQALRPLFDLDLKDTLTLIENTPTVLFNAVPPSKAQAVQKMLTELGAQVTIRPAQEG